MHAPARFAARFGTRTRNRAALLFGAFLTLSLLVIPAVASAHMGPAAEITLSASPSVSATASVVTTGALTGTVSAATGGPLSGVSVSVASGPKATTDAGGRYVLAGIVQGTRTVTFAKTGYYSQSPTTSVSAGATTTLDVALTAVPTTGTVRGVVTASGKPLSGVRITVSGGTAATSASDGSYSVGDLKPGKHTLTLTKYDFVTGTRTAVITAGATTTVNPGIIQDGILSGTVNSSAGGRIGSVKVTLSAPGSHIVAYAKTWLGVRYLWGGTTRSGVDCSGLTQAVAREAGYTVPRTAATQWTFFQQQNWNVSRPRSGDFVYFRSPSSPSGHHTAVYAGSGKIIEAPGTGLHVRITTMSTSHLLGYGRLMGGPTLTTGADGSYSIPHLEPGTYSVKLSAVGFVSTVPATVIVTAKTISLAATLTADGNLTGSVTTTGGVALSGVSVTVKGGRSATTASNGSYSIPLLEPGTYSIAFSKTGYVSHSRTMVIVSAKTTTVTAALVADGNLSGSVVTTGGVGIAGVSVAIAGGRSTVTASNGSYSIPLLAPGTYTLTFAKAGFVTSARRFVVITNATTTATVTLMRPVAVALRLAGPTGVRVHATLKLAGFVTPAAASGLVTIAIKHIVAGKWRAAGSVKVPFTDGKFAYAFKPGAKGYWRFIAVYSGGIVKGLTYLPIKSAAKIVKVR